MVYQTSLPLALILQGLLIMVLTSMRVKSLRVKSQIEFFIVQITICTFHSITVHRAVVICNQLLLIRVTRVTESGKLARVKLKSVTVQVQVQGR